MIVCVCNNISEKKIHHAVDAGMSTMSDLRTHLNVGTCCGKCAGCARQVLRECIAKKESREHEVQLFLHKLGFQNNEIPA